jgi:hypothetical protein
LSKVRYFEGDHPELVGRLESHFDRVRTEFVQKGFRGALVLGGGYGRGEGGVMMDGNGPAFSNDLDYFLFHDSPSDPSLVSWCREIELRESPLLGIDVEIKCLRADSIGDASRSMMFADLVAGHVVVAGDAAFLSAMRRDLDFSRIDSEEATRLLWNRGSGLFFSACRMGKDSEMGYVIRNHAKLKLALGDAWLCLHGKYTPRCRERAAALETMQLPDQVPMLRQWHAEGVEFKFHPFSKGKTWDNLTDEAAQLAAAWGKVYLAVEEKRLGRKISHFQDYLRVPRLSPASSPARNLALALRDRLKRGACLRPVVDYPRAALMRALPCLLGITPGGVREAARFLPSPQGDPASIHDWEPVYSKWWTHYA